MVVIYNKVITDDPGEMETYRETVPQAVKLTSMGDHPQEPMFRQNYWGLRTQNGGAIIVAPPSTHFDLYQPEAIARINRVFAWAEMDDNLESRLFKRDRTNKFFVPEYGKIFFASQEPLKAFPEMKWTTSQLLGRQFERENQALDISEVITNFRVAYLHAKR